LANKHDLLIDLPSVAIVLLNWNGKKFLEQFLPFLKLSTYPNAQIIVADNGSTDDSIKFLESHYPDIRILANPVNEGFAKGYNTALQQVNADIYLLLNSDVEVTPGWIEPIIALFKKHPEIGACQPKLLAWADHKSFEYAGGSGGWLDRYGYPFCRGRIFEHCETDNGQYESTEAIFWASGAAMFVRADVFHELGGFDPYFFAHQEEIDLCWRMQHAGYQIYACPESVVYHVGGGTLPQGNPKKIFLNFRNNLIMLYKNLGDLEKCWKIPYRIGLDALSAWKNLLKGETPYFKAVIKAHIAFLSWVFFHRKESLFPAKKAKSFSGLYPGNVVWMHFFRGIQTFREIIAAKK
jgi:GT2 family glycosyltransferase